MTLNLNKEQIINRLKDTQFTIPKNNLINLIYTTCNRTLEFLQLLIDGVISGYERNDYLGKTNPLLWEFGHVLFFWEHKTLRLLEDNLTIITNLCLKNSANFYDSSLVNREDRFKIFNYYLYEILPKFKKTINYIIKIIKDDNFDLTPTNCYLIYLGLLHNEMHNESFLFTQKMLELPKPDVFMIINDLNDYVESELSNDLICIEGGSFRQGTDDNHESFTFDNEMPSFMVRVNDFKISKYPITEGEYLIFVENGGYKNKQYWCQLGWEWITKNKINLPIYWSKKDNGFQVKEWNILRPINKNYPMCHISWYEASAYCKYRGGRLPTESEWEYLATDGGEKSYDVLNGNLNYGYGGIVPVDYWGKEVENKWGISQLFGNVWKWCHEFFYPYDGFVIGPVYREMSFPFFGYKKICRGGCWACPSYLINSKYRNFQTPDNRIQFTGFRLALDLI